MKLSARDRQRLQWGFAIVIGGGAVVYAYFHLLVSPLVRERTENRARLASLEEKADQAKMALNGIDILRREYAGLHSELILATNRFVLRPVLGSTIVTVQNLLDPLAQECNLQLDSCVERGNMDIPIPKKTGDLQFERYAMEVAFIGSYRNVCDFVAAVERTNAYACVTDIDVQARAEDPSRHRVTVRIEWPVYSPVSSKTGVAAGPAAGKTPKGEDD